MSENPNSRVGKIIEELAALHFMIKGYCIFWPSVDHGADFMVLSPDGNYIGVQAKKWCRSGSVGGRGRKDYDVLAVVSEDDIWIIPANKLPRNGRVDFTAKKSKWHTFREERLTWEKRESAA